MGRKPFLVKISSMMQKSTKALEPFTTNSWEWTHSNMDKLWEEMAPEDKETFGFDIRKLDWLDYLETYVLVSSALISSGSVAVAVRGTSLIIRRVSGRICSRRTPPRCPPPAATSNSCGGWTCSSELWSAMALSTRSHIF